MKNKNVSKWLKILGISVPALALVLFVFLGPEIIGGQGMLRKDIKPNLRNEETKEELRNKKPIPTEEEKPETPQLPNPYGGQEQVITPQIEDPSSSENNVSPQIATPTSYYGGEIFSKANNQAQVMANSGKGPVFIAKIKDELNSRVQYIKSIKVDVFGLGACQNASSCIQDAYININTEGETDYVYIPGTVHQNSNVLTFENISYKLNDGKTANLTLVLTLKNSQPMPKEKSMFQILLPAQNVYITDETGTNVKLRSTTGTTVKGDEYYINY
jgi:hypothetical protein